MLVMTVLPEVLRFCLNTILVLFSYLEEGHNPSTNGTFNFKLVIFVSKDLCSFSIRKQNNYCVTFVCATAGPLKKLKT